MTLSQNYKFTNHFKEWAVGKENLGIYLPQVAEYFNKLHGNKLKISTSDPISKSLQNMIDLYKEETGLSALYIGKT